jgi:tetratricopeptide (TPR) repeat protein
MEIIVQLAGVQLGPYSEAQIRQHLSEGLLSLTDPAKLEGQEDWLPLSEVLAKLPAPTDAPPEDSEAPKRAPSAPPGVTHLPMRRESTWEPPPSLPSALGHKNKNVPIGPTAPAVPFPAGQSASSPVTTSPLLGTKKVARSSLARALSAKTTPLSNKGQVPPPAPPASGDAPQPPQPEAKKAFLPSLIRALTAKTVPLRSAPSQPSSQGLPVTTPLPTKHGFKPASETVPPPSEVKTLTKKLGQKVIPGPEQAFPPTGGQPLEDETTKIPPPTQTQVAETREELIPIEPVDEPPAPAALRRLLHGLMYVSAALALCMVYYVWSPYHAAASLRNALDDGDPIELAATIDFPSVRASLKEQIKNQLAESSLQDAQGNSAAASPSSTVLSMIDQSIDLYVTPEGISGLVKKSAPFSQEQLAQTISPDTAAKILIAFNSLPVRNQGPASLGDFVLDWDKAMLRLQFQGMGWTLKRIDLRPDLGLRTSSGAAAPLLGPVVDTYLERGDAESKKANWNGAIDEYTQVLAIDPRSSIAYNGRAAAWESKGDVDKAIKDYTQALAIDSQMAAAYNGRGNAKVVKNDLDGAIADYTEAVRLDPTLATAFESRGNAKTGKDDLEGAIADFTQAISIDPNLAGAYSDRGFARQANGNLDGAISDYTQALALKPKTAIAYYNRGLARQSQGNLEAAIIDFDRALAFDPKIAGAYYNRGNAKNATHDVDGAIADFTQAVALNPKFALAYSNRGVARQAKGDFDGAIADYSQAITLDHKIALAYYNRGLIEEQENNLDSAIADSSQALDLDPKNALAYYNRGIAKLLKGNLDGALTDLKQFCDLAPRDHNADHARLYLWLIAKAQNLKSDVDQELSDALENAWNSSPDDLITKTAAFLLGRLDEAAYLAAATSPDAKTDLGQHCEAWYFAGMKRLLMGDKATAIDDFHKCLATGQKDYGEYVLAQAELQALEATAPLKPAPVAVPVKSP